MEIDHRMLEKYWSGRCTPEERIAVETWMAGDVPDQAYELRAPQGEDALKARLWQAIQGNQDEPTNQPEHYPSTASMRRIRTWLIPVGIAASLLIGISLYLSRFSPFMENYQQSIAEYREIKVPYGKKMQVTLPDSTTVYLNAGSTFKYPIRFNGNRRHVVLDGEGFFDVMQAPEQPFVVETSHVQVKVLGTRFNIQSRDGGRSSLTVETGRVQFTASGCRDTLILGANERGTYDGKNMEHSTVNSHNYTAWKTGEIIFNSIPLADALADLERWYDVRIRLQAPGLAAHRIKASFASNASLSSVLHDLAFSMNINYTIKNKEVILYQ